MGIVREYINFEKNPYDPFRSMGIGHKKTLLELIAMYKKVLQFNMGPSRKEFANEIIEVIPERLCMSCGWGNAFKNFDELSDEELDQFNRVITKYYHMFKSTNESVNFERGGDPLDRMKIGRRSPESERELKKKYKELVNAIQLPKNVHLQRAAGDELLKFKPQRYKNNHGWANLDDVIPELTRKEYLDFEKIVLKFWDQLKDPFNKVDPNQFRRDDYIITEQ